MIGLGFLIVIAIFMAFYLMDLLTELTYLVFFFYLLFDKREILKIG